MRYPDFLSFNLRHGLSILYAVMCGVFFGSLMMTDGFAQDEVEIFYSNYQDDAGLTVVTPSIRATKELTEDVSVQAGYTYETFDKQGSSGVDVVSGASSVSGGAGDAFESRRRETRAGAAYRMGDLLVGGLLAYSREPNYRSDVKALDLEAGFLNNNVTLTAAFSTSADEILISKDDPAQSRDETRYKDIDKFDVSLTQIISPTTLVLGGYSLEQVEGYQANPKRVIRVEVSPTLRSIKPEVHPEDRLRRTWFIRGRTYFQSGTALDMNLSYYRDDWQVSARSVELRTYQYLSAKWLTRVRYRYYDQSAAGFYKASYSQVEPIMTADTRLRPFNSSLAGLKFSYLYDYGHAAPLELSMFYDYYWESNDGVSADILGLNILYPF